MDFLKKLLPTIGHLLGGPLGGAAIEAAGKALGLSDATADKAAWATYRQALRDITAQAGFPWTITWPDAP